MGRMWFCLGSTGEESGLFPFLTLVHFFSCRLQSGEDPRGGSRGGVGDKLGLLRAGLEGGQAGGLLACVESAHCPTLCSRCVGAAGFDSWAGKEMSRVMKTIAMEKAEDSGVDLIRKWRWRTVVEPPPPHPTPAPIT